MKKGGRVNRKVGEQWRGDGTWNQAGTVFPKLFHRKALFHALSPLTYVSEERDETSLPVSSKEKEKGHSYRHSYSYPG